MLRRIVAFILVAWLPLLVLSAVDGHLPGGGLAISFLMNAWLHVRFMVAMPMLIAVELIAHERLRPVAEMFMLARDELRAQMKDV